MSTLAVFAHMQDAETELPLAHMSAGKAKNVPEG